MVRTYAHNGIQSRTTSNTCVYSFTAWTRGDLRIGPPSRLNVSALDKVQAYIPRTSTTAKKKIARIPPCLSPARWRQVGTASKTTRAGRDQEAEVFGATR